MKYIKQKSPFNNHSLKSTKCTQSGVRSSIECKERDWGPRLSYFNWAGDSTRETNIHSEMKSTNNAANTSSDYSFNERGFKEIPLRTKTKMPRPMTAVHKGRGENKI